MLLEQNIVNLFLYINFITFLYCLYCLIYAEYLVFFFFCLFFLPLAVLITVLQHNVVRVPGSQVLFVRVSNEVRHFIGIPLKCRRCPASFKSKMWKAQLLLVRMLNQLKKLLYTMAYI